MWAQGKDGWWIPEFRMSRLPKSLSMSLLLVVYVVYVVVLLCLLLIITTSVPFFAGDVLQLRLSSSSTWSLTHATPNQRKLESSP